MRTVQLTDNVTQLTRLGAVNAYLVRENDGFTLIDTMFSGSAKAMVAAATELGTPIRRIALTHPHSDHAGSVDGLREILGAEVPFAVPARDARIMAGDKTLDPGEGDLKLRGGWPKVKTEPDLLLAPGERVGSLEAVAAPGHTPGHLAFLDTRDRALICGDAFQTLGGTTVAGQMNWRFPLVKFATWDPARSLASARELRALEPTLLAPGHGRGLKSPLDAIDRAIAGAKA